MAKDTKGADNRNASAPLGPPLAARALIVAMVDATDKAGLIGDLEEEFHLLARRSPRHAQSWYWRQAI